jgi:hypothetical protein
LCLTRLATLVAVSRVQPWKPNGVRVRRGRRVRVHQALFIPSRVSRIGVQGTELQRCQLQHRQLDANCPAIGRDRIPLLGSRAAPSDQIRMRKSSSPFELVGDPLVISDDVVFAGALEWKSGQSCRVRIPLNIVRMATEQLCDLSFEQSYVSRPRYPVPPFIRSSSNAQHQADV